MVCKSFKDIFNEMGNWVKDHENIEIRSIVHPSEGEAIGKYGWILSYNNGKKVEKEFIIEMESLTRENAKEDLDTMSSFLLDPSSFLELLKHITKNNTVEKDVIKDLLRKELLFLARIDHLQTIKTKE